MKNSDIITLVRSGLLEITTTSLIASEAYATYILKKELRNAFLQLQEQEKALFAEAGIEDPNNPPKDEAVINKANALLGEMWKSDTPLSLRTIPYESWHKLKEDNKDNKALSGEAEMILEGIFWQEPGEQPKA